MNISREIVRKDGSCRYIMSWHKTGQYQNSTLLPFLCKLCSKGLPRQSLNVDFQGYSGIHCK